MKKLPMLCLAALFFCEAHAQLTVDPGSSLTFQNGTQFHTDGLTFIPSADFILSNVVLSRSATAVHAPVNPYISRVYQFSSTSDAFSGSIQIDYADSELNGIPEANLTLNIHDGTNWAAHPASTRDASNNYVLTDGLSGITLNELTLADELAPLPITLLDFSGYLQDHIVYLKWTTASEINSDHFTIERSGDGTHFQPLADIPAANNSSSMLNYEYDDHTVSAGRYYYRLKMVDKDGHFVYSKVISIEVAGNNNTIFVYPNPLKTGENISMLIPAFKNKMVNVSVTDVMGRHVLMSNVLFDNSGYVTMNNHLLAGTYIIQANAEGLQYTTKIAVH